MKLTTKQLIELWETFLLQLDAEDEVPGQTAQEPTIDGKAAPLGGDGAPDVPDEPSTNPEAVPATATDVALEQDA